MNKLRKREDYQEIKDKYMVKLLLNYRGEDVNSFYRECKRKFDSFYIETTNYKEEPLISTIWYNLNRDINIL